MGLVPVAVLAWLKGYQVVGDYCIGANGPVGSVALFSECPLEEIQEIWLDFESRTSVALLQILLRDHWKISPRLLAAEPGYEKEISGKRAGLVIGDRALRQSSLSAYKYDLAAHWKEMTGLPFVFAAWVSRAPVADLFIQRFNETNALGLARIPEIVSAVNMPEYDLMNYYTRDIQYRLDTAKKEGMIFFLEKLRSFQEVPS
jgi:chorismate dehydratase